MRPTGTEHPDIPFIVPKRSPENALKILDFTATPTHRCSEIYTKRRPFERPCQLPLLEYEITRNLNIQTITIQKLIAVFL